jgi:hypothetical protein
VSSLPGLLLEYVGYMGALALLAWRWERRSGRDAFGLVAAVAGAVLLVLVLSETPGVPLWAALTAGATMAAGFFATVERATDRFNLSLLEVLFLATAALLAFDGITEHAPVALGVAVRGLVPWLALVTGLVWAWELWGGLQVSRLTRRIGRDGSWALAYWRMGWRSDRSFPWPALPLFLPIVGLPLATTGMLSTTLLKDVALAILLARVTGSRPPVLLLLMAATLGTARLGVGYLVAGSAGPPLVEAAAFIAALLWLRQKGFRAVFSRESGRASG